ncbi:MAG: hypothetical protein HC869_12950 [Rhodospirillales bacterium]|nr:hypothetical protein [Rhodospirillales bacterium]
MTDVVNPLEQCEDDDKNAGGADLDQRDSADAEREEAVSLIDILIATSIR